MKRIVFLLVISFLLVSLNVLAQDSAPPYRLGEPTAQEYLNGILEFVPEAPTSNDWTYGFDDLISTVLFLRYPRLYEVNYETLLAVYHHLGIGVGSIFNRDEWNKNIIHAWLRENQIDLSTTEALRFADYLIRVLPHDFDADGTDEYLLDVVKGSQEPLDRLQCNYQAEYVDYLVVQQQGTEYELLDTPFYWYGSTPYARSGRDGGIVEIQFGDITGDGVPEWVLADGGYVGGGPGMGWVSSGGLQVLNWRDGTFIDIMPQRDPQRWNIDEIPRYEESDGAGCLTMSRDVTWNFTNTDNDSALEIEQQQVYLDNWFCESFVTKSFDWESVVGRYIFTGTRRDYSETRNCAQRQAEEAMWVGDYQTALDFYEQALTLEPYSETFSEDADVVEQTLEIPQQRLDELDQYMRARLALAYILTGRSTDANSVLEQLASETIISEPVHYFIIALSANTANPQQACIRAYEVFTTHYPSQFYGITIEIDAPEAREYYPERIGCDAPALIDNLLMQTTFSTTQSPIEQLSSLGLQVQQSLEADLNNDGQNEWLVWLDIPVLPIFFTPEDDIYQVSHPAVDPYHRSEGVQTWGLPGDAGTALVYVSDDYFLESPPWFAVYDPFASGMGGGTTFCITEGFAQLRIWRMEGNELIEIFHNWMCRDTVAQMFPEGEGSTILDGGEVRAEDGYNPVLEYSLLYVWDEARAIYINPSEAAVGSTPVTPSSTPTPMPRYTSVTNALAAQDYPAALEMTASISGYCLQNANCAMSTYYYRAFAYEALNRYDEALTQYMTIYTTARDSVWGALAALHLEHLD
jgi:tetratricopeptide (TPR) repeat protein